MSAPASDEALVGELLERVSEAGDFQEAGLAVLAAVLDRVRFGRAGLVARVQGTVRAAGWQVDGDEVDALARRAGRPGSGLAFALDGAGSAVLSPSEEGGAPPALEGAFPVPFDGEGALILLLDADEPDAETELAVRLLARCATPLVRLAELEGLRQRSSRLSRDWSVGRQLLDGIPDPVLLLDGERRVRTANDRAHELLFPEDSDTDGRARAVQFNAFHLNVLLTEMNLAGEDREAREITLADPRDGSDLHFEVLPSLLSGSGEDDRFQALILRDITDLKVLVTELEMENRKARQQQERALKESRRLTAILENVGEPVLVTDTDSDIALMNREAERLFGGPADEVSGRERVTRSNVAKLTSFVNELLLNYERRQTSLLHLTDPEEGEIPMEVVSTKVLDERKETVAVVSVLRDLSAQVEKERLAEELRELNEGLEERVEEATRELEERNRLLEWQSTELEKASRLKSQFLASMSHELRTPINAMLGYTSLMRDRIYGPLNDEQERALDKVNAASEHLLELINDILDLTKIEAGKMPVEVQEVRLEAVFDEIAKTIRPMMRDEGIEFRRELNGELPVLRTDRTKVRQVLLNLLENAVRHTPEGWVALRASRADGGPGDGGPEGEERVRLEVEDTGVGIAEEDLETIFEDFHQLESSRIRREGGAGLGLSISKKLVSLMGGTIQVESEVDRGTLFVIELPVELEPGGVEEQVQRVLMTTARQDEADPPVSAGEPPPGSPEGGD